MFLATIQQAHSCIVQSVQSRGSYAGMQNAPHTNTATAVRSTNAPNPAKMIVDTPAASSLPSSPAVASPILQ